MSKFINSKEDLNKYYEFDDNVTVDVIDNHLQTVESDYILPILGKEFFNEMATAFNTTTTPAQEELITYLQKAVVELAAWLAIDEFNVSFSAGGLVVTSDRESGLAPASEARTEKLKASLKRRGFNSIDRLITHLEMNKGSFATWSASSEFSDMKSHFVNTTKEFNAHSNQNLSRFIFAKILPFIELVEQQSILSVLGDALFAEIKSQILTDALSDPNKILMRKIQPALVYLSFSKAILPLGIHVDGFGLSMFNNSFSGSPDARQAPETVLIDRLISDAQKDGLWWLQNLSDYLKKYAANYPLYQSSDAFIDIDDPTTTREGVIKISKAAIT